MDFQNFLPMARQKRSFKPRFISDGIYNTEKILSFIHPEFLLLSRNEISSIFENVFAVLAKENLFSNSKYPYFGGFFISLEIVKKLEPQLDLQTLQELFTLLLFSYPIWLLYFSQRKFITFEEIFNANQTIMSEIASFIRGIDLEKLIKMDLLQEARAIEGSRLLESHQKCISKVIQFLQK